MHHSSPLRSAVSLSWLLVWIPAVLDARVPTTSLTLPLEPPIFGYTTEPAFGSLSFTNPVAISTPRGETNRLFVAEQRGRIAVIPDLAAPTRSVFLDIAPRVTGGVPNDERGLLGFAFHPGYATNGFFYVFYSAMTNGALHQRLARFSVSQEDPNRADPDSEILLLSQHDDAGNHNGGDLHFGPDGYLYVALGDEGGQGDSGDNSQRIDKDFFSAILRIDVDSRPDSLPPNPHPAVFPGTYAVPADNPWVGAMQFNGAPVNPVTVRTEFWAVGLRNPWRMSFDSETGHLWVGDVGQNVWEEIDVITRGGNYGWAYREASGDGNKASETPAGFTSEPPIVEYRHGRGDFQGNSVTGGIVYRGQRLSQLTGAYVFADYVTGNIWAIRWDGNTNPPMERLTSRISIAGFGSDPRNGDVLMADQGADTLTRLVYNTQPSGDPLPPTLADTGAFADLATLQPNAGILPYELNVPFWSDGAVKQRWFSVPDTNQTLVFRVNEAWSFPTGAVWVKHFELELTNGVPESRRRLETRFIVTNPKGAYGVTYRWTDPPTNAVLVAEGGLDESLLIHEQDGTTRTQVWRYPSRGECLQCHTPAAGWVLGFRTSQLNRTVERDGASINQLAWLAASGYFNEPPQAVQTLPRLAPPDDESSSVQWRARSWLDANCSHCHRPGGSVLGMWDARASTPTSDAGLIFGILANDEGDPENRLIVPGSLAHSMIHQRITRLGPRRMPPLASTVIDEAGTSLIARWITNALPAGHTFATWQAANFNSPTDPNAAPTADPDGDLANNLLEFLTDTNPNNASGIWVPSITRTRSGLRVSFMRLANRGFILETSDRLLDPASWVPLDVPENQFSFPAQTLEAVFDQAPEEVTRYYRVRIFEP